MRILSLFDGISCGQMALKKMAVGVRDYYSSEIDKYAMDVTFSNFPKTEFIGDVNNVDDYRLREIGNVDIIFAGFPCQNISTAGDRTGLAGSQSSLFFQFYRILEYYLKVNKNIYFLVENVGGISKDDLALINNLLGVDSVVLNSADFSPQRRKRHYWTNIPFSISESNQNDSVLGDILEGDLDFSEFILPEKLHNVYSLLEDGQYWKHLPVGHPERVHIELSRAKHSNPGGQTGFWKLSDKLAKSQTLMASGLKQKMTRFVVRDNFGNIRYPTPTEFERLQGLPDNYTGAVPMNKRYSAIGNGWSVDTVSAILSGIV